MNIFIETITSNNPKLRDRSFFELCKGKSANVLLNDLKGLEDFRKSTENLYERVRACLFLHGTYRYFLQQHPNLPDTGIIPYDGYVHLLNRRFEEAINRFQEAQRKDGPSGTLMSALAEAYHQRSFQILADQVRKSVRASVGNQWMFRGGFTEQHPIRIHPELLKREEGSTLFPILEERTAVRMDLTHSGWSDIFFLGMDYPQGARVLNVSINLGVYGRDKDIKPPIQTYVRVITEPLIRLTSVDLGTTKDISDLEDLFNFGNDYLGLVKAGIISSGCITPAFEGTQQSLEEILSRIIAPGMGLEVVTMVNDIPKGSRFAVSTNLLGSIISALMRATQQTKNLVGALLESERRLVASRAILGEWIGGSGGGWQDSGGVWPGVKTIEGAFAKEGDPEFGISNGCLLPQHRVLSGDEIHPEFAKRLTNSLVLMHGGMAQNVGPILEMVTEKYLYRSSDEWTARHATAKIYDQIKIALKKGDIPKLAKLTSRNFDYPIKTIIPWASTHFTEVIIKKAKNRFKKDYLGFMMLGGMSGGGMGMYVKPQQYEKRKQGVLDILKETKSELSNALPFAMEPVVYNFKINNKGSFSYLKRGSKALLPDRYYGLQIKELAQQSPESIAYQRRSEIDVFTTFIKNKNSAYTLLRSLVSNLFQVTDTAMEANRQQQNNISTKIKRENGFDEIQHEQLRKDMLKGRIGLYTNRLSMDTTIEDVHQKEIAHLHKVKNKRKGIAALKAGKVAVLTLAGGVGSRWTKGAGVIKALNPFAEIGGQHRSFLEVHIAKTNRVAKLYGANPPHIIATSYLTYQPIIDALRQTKKFGYKGPIYVSPGKSIGQRFVPMVRDLQFLWEEMPQEILDEHKQKILEQGRATLIEWAKNKGEGTDYVDNLASQRFSPMGHWFELPNLLKNGVLAELLKKNPEVETIMLHNVDTLGADLEVVALSQHLNSNNMLTFEVIPRRLEDRGGGLAKVNGKIRMLEGLAQPREEDELGLSYYNSMTTWIQVDQLLAWFGLTRKDLTGPLEKLDEAVRSRALRLPTYVTIKDVKYRWGHGQEDIYPVAQIEKLWSDMSGLADVSCGYLVVPRMRGQQLKNPAQLDGWANDGSKDFIEGLMKS